MSTKLEKARTSVKVQKKVIDGLLKNLEELEDSEDTQKKESTIEVVRRKMEQLLKAEEILNSLLADEEELTQAMGESADFEVHCELKLRKSMETLKVKQTHQAVTTNTESKSKNVRLPRLVIEKFDGDYKKWQTFFDSFAAAVDSQTSLSKVEKYNYLRSYLSGDALRVIEGLQLTNENYDKAMNLLNTRFGNKQAIITAHMGELLTLNRVPDENDIAGLRKLHDDISTNVRSLQSLGIEGENYGSLLVPIILELLPNEFKRHVNRAKGDGACWDLTKLLDLVNEEIKVMESCAAPGNANPFSNFSTGATLFAKGQQTSNRNRNKLSCVFCRGPHWSDKCTVITERNTRRDFLRKGGRCFLCLKDGHKVSECPKSKPCFYCKGLHNSAICTQSAKGDSSRGKPTPDFVTTSHVQASEGDSQHQERDGDSQNDVTTTHAKGNSAVLLQTADVLLKNTNNNRELKIKALFDSGSQRTYITERARNFLDLPTEKTETININTFGSKQATSSIVKNVNVTAVTNKKNELKFNALCYPHICLPLQRHSIHFARSHFPDIHFADSGNSNGEIDLLIGSDFMWSFFTGKIIRSKSSNGLIAMETEFGWVLGGPTVSQGDLSNFSHGTNIVTNATTHVFSAIESNIEPHLNDELKEFWDLETLGIREADEKPFFQVFTESIERNKESRYEVNLPFKNNHPIVHDNYELSEQRLMKLHKKLRNDQEFLKKYDEIFQDQLNEGIIEPAPASTKVGETSYLPHHAVIREDKDTTKLRIVFDASAKGNGPSLNDCLKKGPQLTPLLFDILLRFRSQLVALTADIEKAFLQISIAEEDRDYLRFLWFDNVFSDQPTIIRNRFARVVFGVTSSPFCLNATIRKHAETYEFDQDFIEAVLSSFFVDDFVGGEKNVDEAFDLFKKLQLRFLEGHFWLRKWRTNNAELRKRINGVSECKSSREKILGLLWNDDTDELIFDFTELLETAKTLAPTKRNVLKIIASFYDPLGLLQPMVSSMKILLQQIHKNNVPWDQEITGHLRSSWFNILDEFHSIGAIKVERCVEYIHSHDVVSREIHGFSDASKQGYGACVYVRSVMSSGSIKVCLLTSKSRVAPLKEQTIPRLELLGNLLLARLISSVKSAYQLPFHKTFLWTDSRVTLAWIKSINKEYKTFVQNRVNEIRSKTNCEDWYYCSTKDNPADIITRSELSDSTSALWWGGPSFLKEQELSIEKLEPNEIETLPEEKVTTSVNIACNDNDVFDVEAHSSYKKLLRVCAWVNRFVNNLKLKIRKEQPNHEPILQPNELHDAEMILIKENQRDLTRNSATLKTKFTQLNVRPDEMGILRCYGRLNHAPLPQETIFPIFLNSKHSLTRLIVLNIHKSMKHISLKHTLTEVRNKYWICKGRSFVRGLLNKCVTCRKVHSKSYCYPANPPLPHLRLNDTRPFYTTGIDNFGPVYLRNAFDESGEMFKAWVTLYTCASTRAVLLDLVPKIDAECFKRSLTRMIARRGCPNHIISDNGKNFVAVSTQNHVADLGIEWHFNLPLAPWHGGFFERMVRSAKELLRKGLQKRKLNYDQMLTILMEIESIINNRPITYVYPNDLETCVSPNHLLYGRKISFTASKLSVPPTQSNRSDCQQVSNVIQHFWERWKKEYVVNLREQHKMESRNSRQPTIQIADVVLIHEEKLPRSMWRMGVVTEIMHGADNQVRGAVVRTKNRSYLKRPINMLFPIENARDTGQTEQTTSKDVEPENTGNDTNESQPKRRPVRQAAITGDLKRKYLC